jgi:signal transduction histidine kinase
MNTIEDRLHGLFETMNEGVVLHELVYDDQGQAVDYRIHDVNPAFTAQVGIPREAAVGALASELYGTGEAPYLDLYTAVAETEQPTSFRTYFPPLDQHFEISVFAPRKGWFATVFLDITPLVRAQEQLQRERDRLAAIMDASPVGIVELDTERRVLFANERAKSLMKLQVVPGAEHFVIPPEAAILDGEGQAFEPSKRPYRAVLERGTSIHGQHISVTRPDQPTVHLSISGVPLHDDEGDVRGMVGSVEDITAQIEALHESRELHQQIERMRKLESIGRLAGGIAHDFNNLLTPIMGYTEMAQMQVLPGSPAAKNLDRVTHAAQRARDLVGQFLAFGRKQVLAVETCSLNTLVAEYESVLRRLVREDIQLSIDLQPSLATCRVDPSQVEQILLNLASNAVDAMAGPGQLTIETRDVTLDDTYTQTHPEVDAGDYVMLAVSDSGIGMDGTTQQRIFEPFFTTKESDGGTGLGLATVYGLVRQHRGHIWVYSEPGRGSTFKIYLPASEGPARSKAEPRPSGSSREGRELVLLVEDDEAVRELVRSILEHKGYRVIEAANSDQALERAAASTEPIELVLTDVIVPRLNGREIFRRVQRAHPDARVLFMSGYTDNVVGSQGMLEEGINFLQKPFTTQDLLMKVEATLDG